MKKINIPEIDRAAELTRLWLEAEFMDPQVKVLSVSLEYHCGEPRGSILITDHEAATCWMCRGFEEEELEGITHHRWRYHIWINNTVRIHTYEEHRPACPHHNLSTT